jgi:predicted XRE-type DNA-binding protein
MGAGDGQEVPDMTDDVFIGSGNVYADLGFDNPEEMSLKATLAHRISTVLRHRNVSQATMGEVLGIPQSKVSRLMSGKLDGFSVERLLHFLLRLDRDVDITIRKRTARDRPTRLRIVHDKGVEIVVR